MSYKLGDVVAVSVRYFANQATSIEVIQDAYFAVASCVRSSRSKVFLDNSQGTHPRNARFCLPLTIRVIPYLMSDASPAC
jgi:hypothetical protein